MDDLTDRLIESAGDGRPITLKGRTDLEIECVINTLADHPFGPDVFVGLCRSGEPRDAALALKIVERTSSPAVMGEIVREVVSGLPLPAALIDALHGAMIDRSVDHAGHWGLRSQALLGAWLLARSKTSLGYKLVASLLETASDDDVQYLRHVAKITGLVNAHLAVPDLQAKLVNLVEIAACRDEAAMELGLIELKRGLEDRQRGTALEAFTKARDLFAMASATSERRADAELYRRSLTMLLEFQNGRRSVPVADEVSAITQAAFEYSIHAIPNDPRLVNTWLTDRAGEAIAWATLALRLERLEESLGEAVWLEAAMVIERQLLVCYSASRSTLKRTSDGGLEAILRPAISDAVQREHTRLQILELWIDKYSDSDMIVDARMLRKEALAAREASILRNSTEEASTDRVAALLGLGLVTHAGKSLALEEVAAGVVQVILTSTPLVVRQKLEELVAALRANYDYANNPEARALFNSVLIRTLAWQYELENIEPGKRLLSDYLFNPNASEADLQQDYLATVQAGTGGGGVRSEARAIGHGRADVAFDMGLVTIVAELKKTNHNRTLEELLDDHGLQATAYQRSNVRLGLLVVLDLVDRGGTGEHFSASSKLLEKTPPGTTTSYSVAVFRIQGRKTTPSAIKKSPKRKHWAQT
ncbi:hypothetical protein PHLH8_19980 [Pseudomonas sp. Pc102]|uniref:hypothetical protein n=1 Tax=Pseudomonas sp. Pc102 TaxID=2678261 RepID=UPI001BCC5081|nr:hypothetical protein [Pseudomonas sp. Pc102]BBP82356.1 hypothetical protein PHLH8_19980 [Pseudomonas sp. Pc102]